MRSEEQIIFGTLLGDGSMSFSSKFPRYRVNHSSKQESYVWMKYDVLKHLCGSQPKIYINHGKGKLSCRFETLSSELMLKYYNICYTNGKKLVTENWLNRIMPEGLAYWYMDDGGLCNKQMRISTCSFSSTEMDLILNMLLRFDIVATVFMSKKMYPTIIFDSENRNKFVKLIEAYIIPEMEYKINIPTITRNCDICDTVYTGNQPNKLTCSDICAHRLRNNRIQARNKRLRHERKIRVDT